MRTTAILLFLLLPGLAGDIDRLVDRLFDKDPAVRSVAREKLETMGAGTLQAVLARLEARQAGPGLTRVYDLADFHTDETWSKIVTGRVRALVGEAGKVHAPGTKGAALVVYAPQAVHARIAKELKKLRATYGLLIAVEIRIVRGGDKAAKPVAAPRLTCRNGQKASVDIVRQISYVADFETRVNEKGEVAADPVMSTALDGVHLGLRPVLSEKDGRVRILIKARVRELERPMPVFEVPLPAGPLVRIQVPAGRSREVVRLVTCIPGRDQTVDLGGELRLILRVRPMAPAPSSPSER